MLNFLGIGAQKTGTTWLYSVLLEHKEILFPGGKEVHFWDRKLDKGIAWYKDLFKGDDDRIRGEITPSYSILPRHVVGLVNTHFPDLRLIYIIRNPILRAWSSAKMALRRAEMSIEEASDPWFIDHFNSKGSIARGDYERCIRTWRQFYQPGQLLILRYELMNSEPEIFIKKCLSHLRVKNSTSEKIRFKLIDHVFKSQNSELRESLYNELVKIYRDKILSLSDYLNEDLSSWLNEGPSH